MILTYKVKHGKSYQQELVRGKQVAEYALKTKSRSSREVKHLGLPSAISNQILKKYSNNSVLKKIRSVKLTVPSQGIGVDKNKRTLKIPCLKLQLDYYFRNDFEKIRQIELDGTYAYVSLEVQEKEEKKVGGYLGIDLNTTGHIAVAAYPATGKVIKIGKKAAHIHKKYRALRKNFQSQSKLGKVKQIHRREHAILNDLTHKASNAFVHYAYTHMLGIKLEQLEGIRKRAKAHTSFKYLLHSWSYYQMKKKIEYKAKLLGVPVVLVDPAYTSQDCSKCSLRGIRQAKLFKCPHCGHVDHADVNASLQ